MSQLKDLFILKRAELEAFASGILRDEIEAEDVVQEVFVECLLQQESKRIDKAYLFKAVRNRAFNRRRSAKRLLFFLTSWGSALQNFVFPPHHINIEFQLNVQQALHHLSLKQREILLLRIKSGLKISEIAEILQIPEGTVKSRLNSALKKLRQNI